MTRLSTEARAIVQAIHDRHIDAITAPVAKEAWRRAITADAAEFGPVILISQWFDCQSDGRIYRKFKRALARLIDDGFVQASRADGVKSPNVKLTDEGQALLESLTERT